MKLSISNIAWEASQDRKMYALMKENGFEGLEIAPTRIFPDAPYENIEQARVWAKSLKDEYGFSVPSMQSSWFGRTEKIFGTEQERGILLEYTKKAIDFAEAVECRNLVFGCPRNRTMPEAADPMVAVEFFREIGEYAVNKGIVIGMEANPPIYNTNYINDTRSAFDLIRQVNSRGFLLNLDVGTMVYNDEDVDELAGSVGLISHVHISEPGLKPIQTRELHHRLLSLLRAEKYERFVSIETGKTPSIEALQEQMTYLRRMRLA